MDLLVDACQTVDTVQNVDGTYTKQLMLDPEKAWWKTHLVNSPTFARFAYELKEFERLGGDCYNNMSAPRAEVIAKQILDIGMDYRYSIDAKSSESLRDRHNTQATLLDKMQKNRVERAYTLKGDAKRSFMDGILGRDRERDDMEE
jgi:hypothetical protein